MCNVNPTPKLITPGVIAAELGLSLHRVLYVLRTRPHIRPAARAGALRLYDRRAVAMVRHEINSIDARRNRSAPGRFWAGVRPWRSEWCVTARLCQILGKPVDARRNISVRPFRHTPRAQRCDEWVLSPHGAGRPIGRRYRAGSGGQHMCPVRPERQEPTRSKRTPEAASKGIYLSSRTFVRLLGTARALPERSGTTGWPPRLHRIGPRRLRWPWAQIERRRAYLGWETSP